MKEAVETPVLVVVDMQRNFFKWEDYAEVRHNVAQLLRGAVRDNIPVIILEFNKCGKTRPELLNILKGHKKYRVKTKYLNDGSAEVEEACIEMGVQPTHYVVCGLFFECCVRATVLGLRRKARNSKISVVVDACNPLSNESSYKRCYSTAKRPKLVRLYTQSLDLV